MDRHSRYNILDNKKMEIIAFVNELFVTMSVSVSYQP